MRRRNQLGWIVATAALSLSTSAAAVEYSADSGRALYLQYCASCHGREAHGDGPISASLKVAPADLTSIAQRHGGHFPDNWVYRVIDGQEYMWAHGPREMPVWGLEFWREEGADVGAGAKARDLIDRLVAYLRDLQVRPMPTEQGSSPR